VAVTGDATNLYNSTYEGSTDVVEASRSAVWLQPDTIVVYDRAETHKDGRFKRFWLQLPAQPTIDGHRATVRTAGGQELLVTTLLSGPARLTSEPADRSDDIAIGDPIRYRLKVEDPSQPRRVEFLHVLHGADAGTTLPAPVNVTSSAYTGALVDGTVVLFVKDLHRPVTDETITLPANVRRGLLTGMQPGAAYAATVNGPTLTVRAAADATRHADPGGVLDVPVTR
jgi:hypothetical protein